MLALFYFLIQRVEQKKQELKKDTVSSELLKKQEEELKKQEEEYKRKEEELKKKERVWKEFFLTNQYHIRLIKFQISKHFKLTPWNVDTISHDKFAKTIINKEEPKKTDEQLTEEERAQRYVRKFL